MSKVIIHLALLIAILMQGKERKMKYFVMKESVKVEDTVYPTYAIVSPTGLVVHDVTPNMKEAYMLAEKFEEESLMPVHFLDAVEDFLAQ